MIPPFPLYSGWAEFWDLAGFRLASPFALRLRPPAATYRTRPAGIPQTDGVSLLVTVQARKAPRPRFRHRPPGFLSLYPVFSLCPDSGRRWPLSGDRVPPAPPASLLLCFFGARSSSLRSTPSVLLRPIERPLAPAPSPAKSLRSRSLLFLVCRRPSLRWPLAHTRVPGCTGPAEQTAPKFPNLHRSLSASLRSGSTVLQCPPQLSRSANAVCPQGWV
ncbi:hypothetical protein NDU88_011586 [Pleurodeles waltl]|uniref:Uncharacterized protein n=1 Tax=Pleurodeles waltl TaxID=8319 RepID=A0AAV7S5V9_PLEWA|nr:hypothetical protein NDU88_011586 [Pleurodeles waltl]